MKLLKTPITCFVAIIIVSSCSGKKKQETISNQSAADTTQTVAIPEAPDEGQAFAGEYLIGDGGPFIVKLIGDTYEVRDEQGVFVAVQFQGKENDTLSLYANKDKSITFKMSPDHKSGMYYAPGEEWPVSYLESAPEENPTDSASN